MKLNRKWAAAAVVATAIPLTAQFALAGGGAAAAPAWPVVEQEVPLHTVYQGNYHGSITRIANTLVTCDEKKAPLTKGLPSCATARTGVGQGIFNNNYLMKSVNAFPAASRKFGAIHNSSGAVLGLPTGSTVKYARLYWGGTYGFKKTMLPLAQTRKILFRVPGAKDYVQLANDEKQGLVTGTSAGEHGFQSSADVTRLVRKAGNGAYTVANIAQALNHHAWGGWTLVVAYENCDKPLRHIHLWDGFRIELPASPAITAKVSGFETPTDGKIQGRLGYVTYDGDRTYTGDTVQVQTDHGPLTTLTDAENPADDIMNSTITEESAPDQFARTPQYVNQFGYDSDRLDISPLLAPGDTSMTFTFNTHLDGYQLGAVFSYVNLDNGDN